jgi:hypothetical protein
MNLESAARVQVHSSSFLLGGWNVWTTECCPTEGRSRKTLLRTALLAASEGAQHHGCQSSQHQANRRQAAQQRQGAGGRENGTPDWLARRRSSVALAHEA